MKKMIILMSIMQIVFASACLEINIYEDQLTDDESEEGVLDEENEAEDNEGSSEAEALPDDDEQVVDEEEENDEEEEQEEPPEDDEIPMPEDDEPVDFDIGPPTSEEISLFCNNSSSCTEELTEDECNEQLNQVVTFGGFLCPDALPPFGAMVRCTNDADICVSLDSGEVPPGCESYAIEFEDALSGCDLDGF